MTVPRLVYTISADCRADSGAQTRVAAASAMCLVDDWAEAGFKNVVVTDPFGVTFSREAFRATLPIVRRMAERRR